MYVCDQLYVVYYMSMTEIGQPSKQAKKSRLGGMKSMARLSSIEESFASRLSSMVNMLLKLVAENAASCCCCSVQHRDPKVRVPMSALFQMCASSLSVPDLWSYHHNPHRSRESPIDSNIDHAICNRAFHIVQIFFSLPIAFHLTRGPSNQK